MIWFIQVADMLYVIGFIVFVSIWVGCLAYLGVSE